jgi:hypothetical protein
MPELVTIPNSVFEYIAEYERPIIALWLDRARLVQAVFDSLASWGALPENIEGRNEGKAADQGFAIKLPNKRATFFFGPIRCKVTINGADWGQADEIISLIDTALRALLDNSLSTVKNQKTVIALHLQPKTMSFRDILAPFWPDQLLNLHPGKVRTGAVILRWENAGITLDGSGSFTNGVFLRLERDFHAAVGYEEIARTLREDEIAAMTLLGVEEERQ